MTFLRQFVCLTTLIFGMLGCGRAPVTFHSTDMTGATFGQDFSLPDTTGKVRTLSDFRGKAVVLFFGYTSCPDICPTALARFADVLRRLGDDAGHVQVVFVSLDPERDTPARLHDYLRWFDPSFIGLRGTPEQTKKVTEAFRVFSARAEVQGSMGYVMDHSSGAYVFDTVGRLRLYVQDTAKTDDLVADLLALLP